MNKKLTIYTNVLFIAYIVLGCFYLLALGALIIRSMPGFAMQMVNLADTILVDSSKISSLLSNTNFLETILFGSIGIVLLLKTFQGLINSILQYRKSIIFNKSLKFKTDKKGYRTLSSHNYEVFTLGFFKPNVYISHILLKSLSNEQLQAVLLHEESHQKNHDPLRSLIVNLINNVMISFPFKKYLQNSYVTLVELKSDYYAASRTHDEKSIIKALHSILFYNTVSVQGLLGHAFSNNPERIPVLVGKQKLQYRFLTSILLLTFSTLVFLTASIYTYKFYDCGHIKDCVKIFLENVTQEKNQSICDMHDPQDNASCSAR